MNRIHALHPDHYLTPLEPVQGGIRAHTHLALVQLDGKPRRCYLKVFSPATRGLANEIAGWLTATALGLPVPLRACLVPVAGDTLSRLHGTPIPDSVAFGVESLRGRPVKYWYHGLSAIAQALARWDHLHQAVAFDDWTANPDRNSGNVIRQSERQFTLIDHSDILTGPAWQRDALDPALAARNMLAEIVWRDSPDKEDAGHIADAANGHLSALTHSLAELTFWWNMLLDPADQARAVGFLKTRAHNGPQRLKARYGLLL